MSPGEALPILWAWTPFLLGGFVWNIIVSLAAMAVGTALGSVLALGRGSGSGLTRRATELLTHICRNVPTFVFLYYLAFLLPFEIDIGGELVTIPAWIKASLALAIAVVGFVSDNLLSAIQAHRRGDHTTAHLFIPNWTMYFVIIVMASSTASVIGVPELVSRSNTVIGALNDDRMMIWIYAYAMFWFFLFCMPLTLIMRRVRTRVASRRPLEAAVPA